jgi:hypothetical protein
MNKISDIEVDFDTESQVTYRQYERVWQFIAATSRPVRIRVPISRHRTFKQAIKKEKTIANRRRISLGMPRYGKLHIDVDKDRKDILIFSLTHNGDLL